MLAMWMLWFVGFLLVATPASAEFGFDEKYERDYNIFNPINQYRPDNLVNPMNSFDPKNPFNEMNTFVPAIRLTP